MLKDLRAALYHLQEALDHDDDRERNVRRAQRKLVDSLWTSADEDGLTLEVHGKGVKPVSHKYEVTSHVNMADMIECILDDDVIIEHSRAKLRVTCPECARHARIDAVFNLVDERL